MKGMEQEYIAVGDQYAQHLLNKWVEVEATSEEFRTFLLGHPSRDDTTGNVMLTVPKEGDGVALMSNYIGRLIGMWEALQFKVNGGGRFSSEQQSKFNRFERFANADYLFYEKENFIELKNLERALREVLDALGVLKFKLA